MDAYSNLAITYFMKGMYYEAKRTYEKALELCPDSVDIRNKLRILEEQHRNIQ
jgi:tetratricopeptide (TPR) repeat protein